MKCHPQSFEEITFCISTATPILFTSKKMMMRAARLNTKLTLGFSLHQSSETLTERWSYCQCPTWRTMPLLLGSHKFSNLVILYLLAPQVVLYDRSRLRPTSTKTYHLRQEFQACRWSPSRPGSRPRSTHKRHETSGKEETAIRHCNRKQLRFVFER